MDTYLIHWVEQSPCVLREIPLGVYQAHSPEAAVACATGEWQVPIEALAAEPFPALPVPALPA